MADARSCPMMSDLRARDDGEPASTAVGTSVSTMSVRRCGRLVASALLGDGFGSCFHGCATVALVCGRGGSGSGFWADRGCDAQTKGGGLAFEFAEDCFFVVEEVADEAVGVALVHG